MTWALPLRSSTCRRLLCRHQVVVIVIVIGDAGFAERFRDRDPPAADQVTVTRLRRISCTWLRR
jgi:hypothetical protein